MFPLLWLLVSCGSDVPSALTPDAHPTPDPPAAPSPAEAECGELISRYLETRAALNTCEIDSDCAEMWPGLCPQGPYYIHREADLAPLKALVAEIDGACLVPTCEPPMQLGMGHCDQGRCSEGRSAPQKGELMDCWDTRIDYLENGDRRTAATTEHLQGITPLLAFGVGVVGTLRLEVDWIDGCTDCTLLVSEHNSGMSRLVEGTRTREGNKETISLPSTTGLYFIAGRSKTSPHSYTLRPTLGDGSAQATHHGQAWQRMCEG